MSALYTGHVEAQVNVFYRLIDWSAQRYYKPVQCETVSNQFHRAIDSEKEESKLIRLLKDTRWPPDM